MLNNINTVLRSFFVFLIFILSTVSFSQDTKIKSFILSWDMSSDVETSYGVKFQCPLVDSNFLDDSGLPSFNEFWEIDNAFNSVEYAIENVVYEIVESTYLSSIPYDNIPETLKSSFSISNSRELHGVSLQLTPIIKEGNVVKKIVSFDLKYLLKSSAAKSLKAASFEDSVLSNGTWYKFSVDKTGVFKIDTQFLEELGVSVEDIDPRNIRIYGNGGAMLPNLNGDFRYNDLEENAIFVSGESDGSFDSNDYLLFYGQGAHDWVVEDENSIFHRKNIYSEKAYYFLTYDKGIGQRIESANEVTGTVTDRVDTYKDYLFQESDRVNLIGAGQQWFGDSFLVNNVNSYSFTFDNIDASKDVFIKVRGASTSTTASSMNVKVNNLEDIMVLNYVAVAGINKATSSQNGSFFSVSTSEIDVNIQYENNGNPSADAYLDYIEIIGSKLLKASGKQFGFRNYISQESSKILEYTIENSNLIDMVWDVTNAINPEIISNESQTGDFVFKAKSGVLGQYHVLNSGNYYTPSIVSQGPIPNQNLHGFRDVEYVIITKDAFISQAQRLADYHIANSGLTVKVVPLYQIYNEFGSGAADVTAIRDFVKYLYDNATTDDKKIKYLCSFGDSTYDYKDRISNNNNIVPVYLAYESFNLASSYVTDDYYGMMDETEGEMQDSDKQDVATGRILVSSDSQAKTVVDKILAYYNSDSFGNWHTELTLLTDDMDDASEFVFMEDMDAIAENIKLNKPEYNIKKIYSDSYVMENTPGGNRYPDVNTAVANAMESGNLLFNYFGHGGEAGFAFERIVTIPDIKSWVNFDKSPLFITITCDFTRFDNPGTFTGGEELIVSTKGGSASLISTTREVYVFYGRSFNKILIPNVLDFDSNDYTIAEALMHTKNEVEPSISQRFFIYYLGDPAMKLARPRPSVVLTELNNKDITQSRDTLKALSKINIKGEVHDVNGSLLSDFNGEVATVIYDKEIERTTLNNKSFKDTLGNPLVLTYNVQTDAVFRGRSIVKNGVFSYDLIIPKDIKPTYGNSKISLYVNDESNIKGGYDLETVIGGINENAEEDLIGPELELFLNHETFQDGGITSATPKLIAKFSDASGINTSSGAIGHSITAVIDGDDSNPIILNEFYEAELDDFTKGKVEYSLRGLEPGDHTLKLKVWDTYNNASDKTLSFTVTELNDFVLENVLNYPNPFINYTEFWFSHNQPNELLDVKIYIYTISGKLIKSINESIQTSSSLSRSISWDGKDDFGDLVGKGVYVYKLQVTNTTTGVRAEKIEKLVLLQ